MKPDRKITNDTIEKQIQEVYHFTNSQYKPDWHSRDVSVDSMKKTLSLSGYNSGFYPITDLLETMKETGEIIPNQDYLIEINVKLTKLEKIE